MSEEFTHVHVAAIFILTIAAYFVINKVDRLIDALIARIKGENTTIINIVPLDKESET